jgi:murein DD-endopeptidase MepM/ murein hydrolase activator NlpD/Ca2+-binding RTX toxin-like protein
MFMEIEMSRFFPMRIDSKRPRRSAVTAVAAEVLEERLLLATVGPLESPVAADSPPMVDRYDFPFPGRDRWCTATDTACYGDSGTEVTQNFGENGHAGDDIAGGLAASGQPVTAIAHGRIVDRRVDDESGRGWGNAWLIEHVEEQEDGTTALRYSLYAHLTGNLPDGLQIGSVVGRGQVIGYVGSTGFSTGPHLHFEIKDTAEFGVGYYPEGVPDGYHDPSEFLAASRGMTSIATNSTVLNRVLDGEITVPLQTDRYVFEAVAGQEVTITADWGAGSRMNWRTSSWDNSNRGLAAGGIRLLSGDDTELARGSNFYENCLYGQSCHSQIPGFTIPFDGTFAVEVSAKDFRTGHYQLAISDPENEFESLTLNATTSSRFEVAGETQEWQFTGRADQLVSIGYDTSRNLQETNIVGPDGEHVASFLGDRNSGEVRNLRLPQDGTYRFELRESVNDGGYNSLLGFDYRLFLTTPTVAYAQPDDHGDSASAATILQPTTAGSLETPGDVDWFRFEAAAGQRYVFETTLDSLPDSVLTLYDTDGATTLAKDDDGGDGYASRIEWTALGDGTYFVQVAAYGTEQTGRYSLAVSSELVGGGPVALNELGRVDSRVIEGTLAAEEQRTYRLQAAHDGLLTIELTQGDQPPALQTIRFEFDSESTRTTQIERGNRTEVHVRAGQSLRVLLEGYPQPTNFRLSLTNLVGMADGVLIVHGTQADDRIELGRGTEDPRNLSINETDYNPGLFERLYGTVANAIRVFAEAGNDTVIVDASVLTPTWINGQSGNDFLQGGGGNDVLLGGGGRDRLDGAAGNDRVLGQGGNDQITGGVGNDSLNGGPGTDVLVERTDADLHLADSQLTGMGHDRLSGIERARLTGGAAGNRLDASGFSGNVTLDGGAGNDLLIGGSGHDRLNGQSGHDTMLGGDGNDRLFGGSGRDIVAGQAGNDLLSGQGGRDRMAGGEGDDAFRNADGEIDELIRLQELVPIGWMASTTPDDSFGRFDDWADLI